KALRDGQQLTREELAFVLAKAKIGAIDNLRRAHLMMRAELDAVVVSGARRGKQFTYALLDERAPSGLKFTHEEALAELTRRYLRSRGPATAADFAWWSGLTLTEARRGFATVQSEFEQAVLEGEIYWFPSSPPIKSTAKPTAHWLATYDEYLIGYKDRSAAVQPEDAQQIIGGEVFTSTCLVNGKVVGVWKRTLLKNEAFIEMTGFTSLRAADSKALVKATEGYSRFLGLPIKLQQNT
ncbi:MAG: winged helix DNA-binding domain-containing protein, partial [Acidobacteria bacterium]|nr:winged helix DNA-binding domain-containing protein [Acidobacteriota bacterium]